MSATADRSSGSEEAGVLGTTDASLTRVPASPHGPVPDALQGLSWRHRAADETLDTIASVEIVAAELHRTALDAPLVVVGEGARARLHTLLPRPGRIGPSGLRPYRPFLLSSYPVVAGEDAPEVVLDPACVAARVGRPFERAPGVWSADALRLLDEVARASHGLEEVRRAALFLDATNCLQPLTEAPSTYRMPGDARIVDVRRARRLAARRASSIQRIAPQTLRIVACAAFSYRLLGPGALLPLYLDAEEPGGTAPAARSVATEAPRLDVGWLDLDERLRL